jgi:hypothetical protein
VTTRNESPAVFLAVWADTRYLTPDDVEAFARTMEEITVQAAFDPLVSIGVHAQEPGGTRSPVV